MAQPKKILVLWSGGLDSTYLIYSLLKQNHIVCACYITLNNNKLQKEMEQKAIKILRKIFEKNKNFKYLGIIAKIRIYQKGSLLIFKQILVWLFGAIYTASTYYNEIALGFVMNDDTISYIKEINNIWKSFEKISYHKLPKLVFYLMKERKATIFEELPKRLRDHVVWCEEPCKKNGKFIICGKCKCCKRMKEIL